MPALFNDSNFQNFGSAFLPISGSAVTGVFMAENLTITRPTTVIDIRGPQNEPAGRILTADYVNGSATLQVSGVFPSLGSTFGFNGNVFYINEVGETYAQGDINKASVNFFRRYN